MKNWKTTTTGVLAIVLALANAAQQYLTTGAVPDLGMTVTALLAGWGLVMAKDATARL
jgi:hypothetical protein